MTYFVYPDYTLWMTRCRNIKRLEIQSLVITRAWLFQVPKLSVEESLSLVAVL